MSFLPSSMYHRRLLLLAGALALGMAAPVLQLSRWTMGRGDSLRADAEKFLVTWQWLPTRRGKILDCNGRVLAQDRPSYDVAVDYRVITGQWARTLAGKRARRLHREEWSKLSREEKRALTEEYLPDFDARVEGMWNELSRMGGISRGELDDRLNAIKLRVLTMASSQRARTILKLEKSADYDPDLDASEIAGPIAEQESAHVILHDVDDRTAFDFIRATQRVDVESVDSISPMPGVNVIYTGTREYPGETQEVEIDRSSFPSPLRSSKPLRVTVSGVGTHLVGWMRNRVFREDNAGMGAEEADGTPNRALYLDGESIGAAGMERAAERELRGLRGTRTTKLDTGERTEVEPEMGRDVQLTVDVELEARIQALLSTEAGLAVVQPWHTARHNEADTPEHVPTLGEKLAGAVVVIEIDTGNVKAMVTSPTFSRQELRDDPNAIFGDRVLMPASNRAISQPYAPGSIVKPLILCAATTSGVYTTTERIVCTGHFLPNEPHILRCWIEKQFNTTHSVTFGHDLDGSDAIMASCNVFFFEMGKRLGLEGISDWFTRFGVGPSAQRWDLGLGYEYAGALPVKVGATAVDSYLLGIGQGQIAWTPMHAADAYATLGRAGIKIRPRLRADSPTVITDLHLNPAGVEQAIRGLDRATTDDDGTVNHITVDTPSGARRELIFNVIKEPGIHIWAKSGTADASALLSERDENGNARVLRDGDHSWCVFLCGDESSGVARPKYAVAVVADYGGSGGRVAGPIANQVARQLIQTGYLKPSAAGPTISSTTP